MRFILNEYLSSLKEDGELDSFIEELLKSMHYIPTTKIQRGRQYGVDLSAIGKDEDNTKKLFLFVIKQGNFSRKVWDGGNVNDIRPSITEILDVYLSTRIPKPYDKLPVKIIVACNGFLEQTVQVNWAQFVNNNTTDKVEFDFWGLDKLSSFAEIHQMQEEILTPSLALQFRRSLSFIDLPDYNLSHLYKFINDLLPYKESEKLTDKQVLKKLRLVHLCMGIINSWCTKSNNLKPAFIASERIILNTWGWLSGNGYIEKKGVHGEYFKILSSWKILNHSYLNKTFEFFKIQDGLGRGISDYNEYCLVTFEQIGIISVMGLYELWECSCLMDEKINVKVATNKYEEVEAIAITLSNLILQNPSSLSPRYDEHCIEINLALTLLYETGFFNVAIPWLKDLIDRMILEYQMDDFFPLLNSDAKKLNIEKAKTQESSLLINMLAEWCLILKQRRHYSIIRNFIKNKMPHLNLQMWIPDKDVEKHLYTRTINDSGTTMVSINLPENHLLLEMNMAEERVIMNEEKDFSCNTNALLFIPYLSSRHFRNYPFPNSWRKFLSTRFCFTEQ